MQENNHIDDSNIEMKNYIGFKREINENDADNDSNDEIYDEIKQKFDELKIEDDSDK